MSQLPLLLLGLWLRTAFAIDLLNPDSSFSPALAFQQFAVHNASAESDLQRNTEPADNLFEATSENPSLFTKFLSGDINPSDEGDDEPGDGNILVRQTRRCPPGTCA
jgi:hypothetical protein